MKCVFTSILSTSFKMCHGKQYNRLPSMATLNKQSMLSLFLYLCILFCKNKFSKQVINLALFSLSKCMCGNLQIKCTEFHFSNVLHTVAKKFGSNFQ